MQALPKRETNEAGDRYTDPPLRCFRNRMFYPGLCDRPRTRRGKRQRSGERYDGKFVPPSGPTTLFFLFPVSGTTKRFLTFRIAIFGFRRSFRECGLAIHTRPVPSCRGRRLSERTRSEKNGTHPGTVKPKAPALRTERSASAAPFPVRPAAIRAPKR